MNHPPKLSERVAVAFGSVIFAIPLVFLLWYGVNLWLWDSGELSLIWVGVGVFLLVSIGFAFPRHIARVFSKLWQVLLSWF